MLATRRCRLAFAFLFPLRNTVVFDKRGPSASPRLLHQKPTTTKMSREAVSGHGIIATGYKILEQLTICSSWINRNKRRLQTGDGDGLGTSVFISRSNANKYHYIDVNA